MTVTTLHSSPSDLPAATKETPFVKQIDSSVPYNQGLWFSSGIWAIKISTDGQSIIKDGRHFSCPGYWPVLKDRFTERLDAVAYAPSPPNDQDGFWIFNGDKCIRVDRTGDKSLEGPVDIMKAWPRLKDSDFGIPIGECTYVEGSSPPQYLFVSVETAPQLPKVLTYTRPKDIDQHKASTPVPIVKQFPELKNYPDFVQNLSSCLVDGDGGYWFFSQNLTCRVKKNGTLDPAPGEIAQYWPALAQAKIKEECD
jgi:hypothetical protein